MDFQCSLRKALWGFFGKSILNIPSAPPRERERERVPVSKEVAGNNIYYTHTLSLYIYIYTYAHLFLVYDSKIQARESADSWSFCPSKCYWEVPSVLIHTAFYIVLTINKACIPQQALKEDVWGCHNISGRHVKPVTFRNSLESNHGFLIPRSFSDLLCIFA